MGYDDNSFYDTFIKGRLRVGVSLTSSSAATTTAPENEFYLGNLNNLKEDDRIGIGFNLQYDLCDYIALSFANDTHLELSVWNNTDESTDGSIIIDGILYQVILQYPFRFTDYGWGFTPYVGFGIMDISLKWSYANWWHYGWSTPNDYKRYGYGSTQPRNDYSRWMVIEEPSNVFTVTIGLAFHVMDHFDIDFFYRSVPVDDVRATFHALSETGVVLNEGSFPVEFSMLGLALRCVF